NLSRSHAQDLAHTVGRSLAGLGLVKGGVALLGSALSLNLPALLVSRAVQAVSAAWLTRLAGRSFIVYFQQGQDWGDGGLPEVLQREYDLNRREGVLRRFLEAAYRQVVEPLKQQALRLPPQPDERSEPLHPQAAEPRERPIRKANSQEWPKPLRRRPPEAGEAGDRSDRAR
ncbi:MAG: YcjF family protein, partial [Cyanobium sp.]